MWLAIDAGNTNVVLGVFDSSGRGPRPLRTYRLSTHPIATHDELKARVQAVLATGDSPLKLADFDDIVLASVVPRFTRIAKRAFPELRVIDSSWPFSFKIGTENPAQTGIDRLVNAEAYLREHGRGPAILVDSGTTTTLCALDSEQVFLGGSILPGLHACRDALPAKAAQLFTVELTAPKAAIGRGTDAALRSGVVLGYASMIEGMVGRFKGELGAMGGVAPRVILTGGVGRLLRELCPSLSAGDAIFDPDLTLKGIAYLYESARAL
jgi:type III pantothenate kinase